MLYQAFIDAFNRLGAHVIGISADHVQSHQAFARDAQLHFPLLANCQPRGRVAKQYGVWREAQRLWTDVTGRQHIANRASRASA